MDVDYYQDRHRAALLCASMAATPDARIAHLGLARGYARLIAADAQTAESAPSPDAARHPRR